MTEPPHPHFPSSAAASGSNPFHPHHPYPSGPWAHQHYAYNTHWRAYRCGRFKGRLFFFALGAGAAALYYRGQRNRENGEAWGPGPAHGSRGPYSYPTNALAPGAGAAVGANEAQGPIASYEDRQSRWGQPHHPHSEWRWGSGWAERCREGAECRRELEPRRVPVTEPESSSAATTVPAGATSAVENGAPSQQQQQPLPATPSEKPQDVTNGVPSNHMWGWGSQDAVRGAVDLTESGLDSIIATVSALKLKLKAAEARAFEAEEKAQAEAERKAKNDRERKLV